jgi:hypothetical protein
MKNIKVLKNLELKTSCTTNKLSNQFTTQQYVFMFRVLFF